MREFSHEALLTIASQFGPITGETEITPLGNGRINDTYLVSTGGHHFVLQKINTNVFKRPNEMMGNLKRLADHARNKSSDLWEIPGPLRTVTGHYLFKGESDDHWRALNYISDSYTVEYATSNHHAREVGRALGMFHALIADLDPLEMEDTLEGFHITPQYLAAYDQALKPKESTYEERWAMNFVEERRDLAHILEEAKASGDLTIRLMHGDPKINNVLFDSEGHHAKSLIDLDTVKPGLIHYDIGDCLRSACNTHGEDTSEWRSVQFDLDKASNILDGYFQEARGFLCEVDVKFIFDSVRLLAFELGLRFFTDHLNGDTYFKVSERGENLMRALVQFQLCHNLESKQKDFAVMLEDLV